MTFQLDTTGTVMLPHPTPEDPGGKWASDPVQWPDLSPFAQGYIEALFDAEAERLNEERLVARMPLRRVPFSDLAPETLARIIADERTYLTLPGFVMEGSAFVGQKAWVQRQEGWPVAPFGLVEKYRAALPIMTVQLGEDGKVRFAA